MKLIVYTDGGPTANKALAFAAQWVRQLQSPNWRSLPFAAEFTP